MSRLRHQLDRLSSAGEHTDASSPSLVAPYTSSATRLQELRARIEAVMAKPKYQPQPPRAAAALHDLPASPSDSEAGVLYSRVTRYPLCHRHGSVEVGAFLEAQASVIATLALDQSLNDAQPARLLFFDLETTGLAGGTGTLAFLVGLGFIDTDAFCVEQLFLPRPGEEAPLLARIAERIKHASALVSFNGKAFDWPLLHARFVLNRLPVPTLPPHFDLLHAARRIFRRRLVQTRLGTIEREVLDFERQGDIDGAFIPARYFSYLRDGDGAPLVPVFEHNALDLLALAALLARMSSMFNGPSTNTHDPRDHLGLAEVAVRAKDHPRALSFAHAAAAHTSGRCAVDGLRLAALVQRCRGDYGEAAALLEHALCECSPADPNAAKMHLALAKIYEHRLKSSESALGHAQATVPAESLAMQQRRLLRLNRRLVKAKAQ